MITNQKCEVCLCTFYLDIHADSDSREVVMCDDCVEDSVERQEFQRNGGTE